MLVHSFHKLSVCFLPLLLGATQLVLLVQVEELSFGCPELLVWRYTLDLWNLVLRVRLAEGAHVTRIVVVLLNAIVLVAAGVATLHLLFDHVRLDWLLLSFEIDGLVLAEGVLVGGLLLLLEDAMSHRADADLTGHAFLLDTPCNHNTGAEDIVADDLGTDDTCNDRTRVDARSQVQVLNRIVLALDLGLDVVNHLDHLHRSLDDPLGLVNECCRSGTLLVLEQLAVVAHYQVEVANQVNLVDLVLNAHLIQSLNDALFETHGITHVQVTARLVVATAHRLVQTHDLDIE